jgi:hypothetical protein
MHRARRKWVVTYHDDEGNLILERFPTQDQAIAKFKLLRSLSWANPRDVVNITAPKYI